MNQLQKKVTNIGTLVVLLSVIHSLSAAPVNFAEDFSSESIPDERFEIDTDGDSTITVEKGKARLTAVAADDKRVTTRLYLKGETDYFEAEVSLSSETALSATASGRVEMVGVLYNDTQEGGFDGFTGDVWSGITLSKNADNTLSIFACLERSDDAVFGAYTELGPDANGKCLSFSPSVKAALDQTYKMSVALDREAGIVTFAVDNESKEYIINTPILQSSNAERVLRMRTEDGVGTTIALVDNVRTSKTAKTSEETNGGTPTGSDTPVDEGEKKSGGGGGLVWMLLPMLVLIRRQIVIP